MKRIHDMRDDDPGLREAQRLLSAVEPLAPSQERMWRVRRGMEQKRAERRGGVLALLRGPRALALSALLVFGGSTLAAAQTGVLRAVISRVVEVIQLAPPTPAPSTPSEPKRARHAPKKQAAPTAEQALNAPLEVSTPEVSPVPAPAVAAAAPEPELAPARSNAEPRRIAHARPAPAPSAQPAPAAHSAGNELVRRAVKALRRDGDPALAGRLLESAHHKSPDGALAEEVMSLRVEAALARGDARARGYAQEYLARYPAGRYREQVQRALR